MIYRLIYLCFYNVFLKKYTRHYFGKSEVLKVDLNAVDKWIYEIISAFRV